MCIRDRRVAATGSRRPQLAGPYGRGARPPPSCCGRRSCRNPLPGECAVGGSPLLGPAGGCGNS
eukprot:11381623-Alexandrium_andersonii.AAC.1